MADPTVLDSQTKSGRSRAGHILQLTHSDTSLFALAASASLLALIVLYLLAPGLKKVELAA
jgi:hypothetical protein